MNEQSDRQVFRGTMVTVGKGIGTDGYEQIQSVGRFGYGRISVSLNTTRFWLYPSSITCNFYGRSVRILHYLIEWQEKYGKNR